jgi:hypothetical protein
VWKRVVSYKMPVKDDGVTLMKDATAQFVQLITAKHTSKISCPLHPMCYSAVCKECVNFHTTFTIENKVGMLCNALI